MSWVLDTAIWQENYCPVANGVLLKPMEKWRTITGFSDYEVSDHGRVRRCTAACGAVVGKVLKTQRHPFGYPQLKLCKNGKHYGFEVHRLVAISFLGPKPSKNHHVAHNDNNPENCRAENLRWATAKENNADKAKFGTMPSGEKNGMARLTEEKVRRIITLRLQGQSLKEIASKYGVSFQAISRIVLKQRWPHV